MYDVHLFFKKCDEHRLIIVKSGSLNLLEPSGRGQASRGIALRLAGWFIHVRRY